MKAEIDRIENLLAEHEIDLGALMRDRGAPAGYTMACACGFRWPPERGTNNHHRRHLADVLSTSPATSGGEDRG